MFSKVIPSYICYKLIMIETTFRKLACSAELVLINAYVGCAITRTNTLCFCYHHTRITVLGDIVAITLFCLFGHCCFQKNCWNHFFKFICHEVLLFLMKYNILLSLKTLLIRSDQWIVILKSKQTFLEVHCNGRLAIIYYSKLLIVSGGHVSSCC